MFSQVLILGYRSEQDPLFRVGNSICMQGPTPTAPIQKVLVTEQMPSSISPKVLFKVPFKDDAPQLIAA